MKNKNFFKGKKVTVVGLARSGVACANLLHRIGAQVSVTDVNANPSTQSAIKQLISTDIRVEAGRHSRDFIKGRDLVVVSPGVRIDAQPLLWAKEFNIPAVSEIEVGFLLCPAYLIAVTGSNGKTTVTTLIGNILREAGKKVFVCGNIGNPFTGEVEKMTEDDFAALEVSSFQLQMAREFRPRISLIVNFNRNHLDRHKDMREYLDAKKRIFANQDPDDYAVLNGEDPALIQLAKQLEAKAVFFNKNKDFNSNQAAVLAVGSILGIDKEIMLKVFKDFRGLEHRMELVGEKAGVRFINDSKATTVESTMWALDNLKSPVVLIAGGRDKGLDYSLILEPALNKVKALVLIGEAKDKIKKVFAGLLPVEEAGSLDDALRRAFALAKPRGVVLLSPMCSSYDMFADYEARGRCFKDSVKKLIQ